jgi:hypothetical protein
VRLGQRQIRGGGGNPFALATHCGSPGLYLQLSR